MMTTTELADDLTRLADKLRTESMVPYKPEAGGMTMAEADAEMLAAGFTEFSVTCEFSRSRWNPAGVVAWRVWAWRNTHESPSLRVAVAAAIAARVKPTVAEASVAISGATDEPAPHRVEKPCRHNLIEHGVCTICQQAVAADACGV